MVSNGGAFMLTARAAAVQLPVQVTWSSRTLASTSKAANAADVSDDVSALMHYGEISHHQTSS